MALILDLFAGPGGWSQACRTLHLDEIGVELDADACATRMAAGHVTVRADVSALATSPMRGRISGLIASPPCQSYSMAGLRRGIGDLPLVFEAIDRLADHEDPRDLHSADPRSLLVVEPLRYALNVRPRWVALEQVPAVLPVWERIAEILRDTGYQTWTGVLNAADYGVPQTRKRAFLIAHRFFAMRPPEPTHAKDGGALLRWVSMAQALGWSDEPIVNTRCARSTPGGNEFPSSRPSWTLTEKARSWTLRHGTQQRATVRALHQPAATLFFGPHLNTVEWVGRSPAGAETTPEKVRVTEEQASVLQGFPADYPWQGTRTKRFLQIGNAVPPPLARAVLSTVTRIPSDTA